MPRAHPLIGWKPCVFNEANSAAKSTTAQIRDRRNHDPSGERHGMAKFPEWARDGRQSVRDSPCGRWSNVARRRADASTLGDVPRIFRHERPDDEVANTFVPSRILDQSAIDPVTAIPGKLAPRSGVSAAFIMCMVPPLFASHMGVLRGVTRNSCAADKP
jgi:hypothetical protein